MSDGIWYMIFDEHKVNEARYMRKFRAYKDVFLDFVYESHPLTLENNFTNSDKEQYQIGPTGEPLKV
jgi:hypothetical protein